MVNNQCTDEVQDSIDDLEHGKRLVKCARVLSLGHEAKVSHVSN